MIVKRGLGDLNKIYRPCKIDEVIGHETIKRVIKNALESRTLPHAHMFIGPSGCVDGDTEFFTGRGWKKISEFKDGDMVMQYNINTGIATLTKPLYYIKKPVDKLYNFKTKYGLNQCLSEDHRVLYSLRKSGLQTSEFKDIIINNNVNKYGFNGKFLTTFSIEDSDGIDFTDDELRVITMTIADSHIPSNRIKCCINLKKRRKILRAHKLLNDASVDYSIATVGDYTRFYFIPLLRIKEFDEYFYKCNKRQLDVISSESLLWDGDQKSVFNTTSKQSADFIQYAFSACGFRASINIDDRRIESTRSIKSITYRVIKSSRTLIGFNSADKTTISEFIPEDGNQYCFTVPTSYLVLRRENSIFITGNCGKTTFARLIALGLNCVDGPTGDPCCKCSACKATIDFNSLAVVEVDAGRTGDVATTREILKDLPYAPMSGERYKIVIFDEAHKLGGKSGSEDALLKFLEDTPEHVYVILCTNEPQKLKDVTRNRCKTAQFNRLTSNDIYTLLEQVSQFEGFAYNKEVLAYIAEESDGVPRAALSYLQMTASEGSWTKEAASLVINAGVDIDYKEVIELCRVLIKGNFRDSLEFYKKVKLIPPEAMRVTICGYFVGCLKNARRLEEARLYSEIIDFMSEPFFNKPKPEQILINNFFKITDILQRRG